MITRRAYALTSRWCVPAPRAACWSQLADPGSWPEWWPHLRSRVLRDGDEAGVGTRGVLVYRSPLGYRLRIGLEVLAADPPERVEFAVVGDLTGRATAQLDEVERDGAAWTSITTRWPVRTTRGWMNAAAPVLAPAFNWAHARVMSAGERGLVRRLTT
ncbi:conserved hypothetical protein [Beutenbergia cavernae DSM 12333]|uniref:Polyketide cyclase/dehydrase n=1 Tax=Beutenbergia cavernae (strain ATCC BAA-8 / DSM 12333 / CCUG 43141 / JCM 11478 / NBRC 16432 / NCIMB 13614 / HKI 0122) TaxID=471853 RepID=C5C459_BEUC1|nr:SRPBCC family protein [Beutenbergia cavernae]ACQ79972.1 conserved hypothetical protein [Beutenbergia cavernae DSM 12333]